MVGIWGAIGTEPVQAGRAEQLTADLRWGDRESTDEYTDGEVTVGIATHPSEPSPVRTGDDVTVWLWGSVWGFDDAEGKSVPDGPPAAYCASLYDEHGLEFVSGLNGNFVGYFNQIHAAGFEETLREDVEYLFTGHYGDMLFKGNHIPTPTMELDGLGSFPVPIEEEVESVEEYVAGRVSGPRPTSATRSRGTCTTCTTRTSPKRTVGSSITASPTTPCARRRSVADVR